MNNPRYPPDTYLSHYGLKDQSWYQHKFGRWQDQAMYAIGKVNPDLTYNNSAKDYSELSKDQKKALSAARNDFRIQMAERGSLTDMLMLSADARSILNTALIGNVGSSAARAFVNSKRVSDYNKRYGENSKYYQIGSLNKRKESIDKEFNSVLDKSVIKDQNLSKEYIDIYSQEMNRLLNSTKTQNKLNKLNEHNKNLKTTGIDIVDNLGTLPIATSAINLAVSRAIGHLSPTGTRSVLEGIFRYIRVDKVAKAKASLPKDSTGLPLKQAAMSAEEDMAAVNPGYVNSVIHYGQSTSNCQMCSTAYELRRRGYDVIAGDYKIGQESGYVWDYFPGCKGTRFYSDGATKALSRADGIGTINLDGHAGKITESAAKNIINSLVKQGDGARGYLNLAWDKSGGHSMSYEIVNGNLVLRDAQVRTVIDSASDIKNFLMNAVSADTIRIDNVAFNADAIKGVLNVNLFK